MTDTWDKTERRRVERPFTVAELVAMHEQCPCTHGAGFIEPEKEDVWNVEQ